ncbi:Protein phosphatase 2C family protein [Candida albicans]|uniref:Protein phosphatase 2C family protein n=1 Tax=Candida albicans TaxID=5476 RepID=A0A8H6BWD6_CANAX|nr:Protein phosphatase 2C family protein [Candida albicans]
MSTRSRQLLPPSLSFVRHVSQTVTFTAMDISSSGGFSHKQPSKVGKLIVPILKSPSHLGHSSSRVNRLYNEDKYSANLLQVKESQIFNFRPGPLVENDNDRQELFKKYAKNVGGYWKRWYKHRDNTVANWEKERIKLKNFLSDDLATRVPLAFLNADYNFFSKEQKSGSTCTSALIETIYSKPGTFQPFFENYYFNRHTISKLSIGHLGDTRAIVADKNGLAHTLTTDHHPSNPIEAKRKFVALANTRAFGDVDYKEVGVTAEPDFNQYIIGDSDAIKQFLTPDEIEKYTIGGLGGDESFLILCSDGVTNILTDQEIADIVLTHVNLKVKSWPPHNIVQSKLSNLLSLWEVMITRHAWS